MLTNQHFCGASKRADLNSFEKAQLQLLRFVAVDWVGRTEIHNGKVSQYFGLLPPSHFPNSRLGVHELHATSFARKAED